MKFINTVLPLAFFATSSVLAAPVDRRLVDPVAVLGLSSRMAKRAVDLKLIPPFGFKSGVNPTGTGDCDGAVKGKDGKPIKIPCACPPDRASFIKSLNANVAAGHAVNNPTVKVSFPTGNSKQDKSARLTAAAITLQNLHGPGKGCPVVSTTFGAQQKAIDAGTDKPASPAAKPPASATSKSAASTTPKSTASPTPKPAPATSGGVDPALIPQFGFESGINPTGTGDCDGAVNGADGKPIKIPCACPPNRDFFIQSLNANVAAGQAVNNPTVKVSFPTGSSKQDQSARLTAAAITLQNLNGPGKGCPVVSTTFGAQQKAIDAGTAAPAPAAPAPPATTTTSTPAASSTTASAPAASGGGVDPSLIPQFGFESGINPTGTGDCDGAVNGADGKPIKIPCACPPNRDFFIQSLNANVAAGHAVNNPTVKVTFPTGTSKQDQSGRLTAAAITLQNLNGPGKGCPVVSTTFGAQQKAIDAEP